MDLFGTLLVFFILWRPVLSDGDEELINPTDLLNFDPVNMRMNNKVQKVKIETNPKKEVRSTPQPFVTNFLSKSNVSGDQKTRKKDSNAVSHCTKDEVLKSIFRRHLMSLVQLIESQIDSTEVPAEFCIKVKASYNDLSLLKRYGTGDIDNVHEVYERLEKMILYATDLPDHGPVYWLEKKIGLSTSFLLLIIALFISSLLFAKALSNIRITRSFIVKGILLAFVFSMVSNFIELYQRKVAHQEKTLTDELTERCPHLKDSSYWTSFVNYLSSSVTFQDESCREYYEAIVVNPIFQVSVLEAGAIAMVKTVVAPMKIIGHGIKDFITGLFKDLPMQYSLYLFVIIMMLFILFPFLIFGYTIRIPFFLTLQAPSRQYIEHVTKKEEYYLTEGASVPKLIEPRPSQPSVVAEVSTATDLNRPVAPGFTQPPSRSEEKVEVEHVCNCKSQKETTRSVEDKESQESDFFKQSKTGSFLPVEDEESQESDFFKQSKTGSFLQSTDEFIDEVDKEKDQRHVSCEKTQIGFEGIIPYVVQSEGCAEEINVSNSEFFLAVEDRTGDIGCDSDLSSPLNNTC